MENFDMNLLKLLLFWAVGGGGSAAFSFFLVEKVKPLKALNPEPKRWAGMGISAVFSMAAYAATVGLGYSPLPVGWQAWLEAMVAAGGLAAGLGELLHGRVVLSKKTNGS
jgi:hypothetical protein